MKMDDGDDRYPGVHHGYERDGYRYVTTLPLCHDDMVFLCHGDIIA